jgi:hypothetical protein
MLASVVPGQSQVTFSDPVSYTVGTNPGGIVTADFNGDGIPDLAVANNGDPSVNDLGSVSLLLGKGDGTFQPAIDASAGPFPKSMIVGDVNSDGKLDLLVLDTAASDTGFWPWNLLLGHGDGTFGAPLQIALTYPLFSLVVGDFNHDQKLDIIFSDTNTGLQQMQGNGDGTFQPAQAVLPIEGFIVVGDFNSDGKLDLAVGGGGSTGSYQTLFGNGDGTFRTSPAQAIAGSLFPVDLNHDGRADFVTETFGLFTCRGLAFTAYIIKISVQSVITNADGTFQAGQQIAASSYDECTATGSFVHVASIGDFDGDGKIDVLVNDSKQGLQLFAGRGAGAFSTTPVAVAGSFAGSPATADLNGDKLADLGAEPLTSTTIGVILNTTPGFWLGAPSSFGPLRAGGSATGTISVNPQNGLTNPVSLACSAPQSAGIQCSLSSSSVAPGANSTVTVTTTGNSAASRSQGGFSHPEWFYALCLPFTAIVFGRLGFGSKGGAKRRLSGIAIGALLLAGIVSQPACGGGSSSPRHNPGTPAGTYTITVTGTSGTIARSTNVQLTVQ